MAATAKGYDITQIRQGPGDLWVIGTAPTDTAVRLTLATDLTPDSVAHPNSVCLGLTAGGITTSIKHKVSEITVDQADAPVGAYTEMVEMTISTELTQQAMDLLQQAFNVAAYSTSAGSYKQLTTGGTGPVPTVCVAAIVPKKDAPTKAVVALMYVTIPVGGLQVLFARDKKSTHKVEFKGLTDLTRTAGKQIGVVYETI